MDVEALKLAVNEGKTQRSIASQFGVSQATVKWWLKKCKLKTSLASFYSAKRSFYLRREHRKVKLSVCIRHGAGLFIQKTLSAFRCEKCDYIENFQRRQQNRLKLIALLGGKCNKCDNANPIVLDFHHVDKSTKSFTIGATICRSFDKLKKEAEKCVLLCANCHRIVEHELNCAAREQWKSLTGV